MSSETIHISELTLEQLDKLEEQRMQLESEYNERIYQDNRRIEYEELCKDGIIDDSSENKVENKVEENESEFEVYNCLEQQKRQKEEEYLEKECNDIDQSFHKLPYDLQDLCMSGFIEFMEQHYNLSIEDLQQYWKQANQCKECLTYFDCQCEYIKRLKKKEEKCKKKINHN